MKIKRAGLNSQKAIESQSTDLELKEPASNAGMRNSMRLGRLIQ